MHLDPELFEDFTRPSIDSGTVAVLEEKEAKNPQEVAKQRLALTKRFADHTVKVATQEIQAYSYGDKTDEHRMSDWVRVYPTSLPLEEQLPEGFVIELSVVHQVQHASAPPIDKGHNPPEVCYVQARLVNPEGEVSEEDTLVQVDCWKDPELRPFRLVVFNEPEGDKYGFIYLFAADSTEEYDKTWAELEKLFGTVEANFPVDSSED